MGLVIEKLSQRQGEMTDMKRLGENVRLYYLCPSRALVGFMVMRTFERVLTSLKSEFKTDTKGTGVLNHAFHSYVPYKVGLTDAFTSSQPLACAHVQTAKLP